MSFLDFSMGELLWSIAYDLMNNGKNLRVRGPEGVHIPATLGDSFLKMWDFS